MNGSCNVKGLEEIGKMGRNWMYFAVQVVEMYSPNCTRIIAIWKHCTDIIPK